MSSSSVATPVPNRAPLQAYIVIAMGVIGISMASIFIRLAQEENIPSLFIAAARMTIASLVLTPVVLRSHRAEIATLTRRELTLAGISGVFLAIHFATWILSFEYTSILVSVVLVSTNPLWIAAFEILALKARLGRWVMVGLVIGIVGSIIVAIPANETVSLGRNPLLGSLLALMGAVAVAVYYIIGRKLRSRLSLMLYIWLVYSCAAVVLIMTVVIAGIPVSGYSPRGYLYLVAMALIPQLIGHSSLNYALKYFPATFVGIAAQLEPALSALAAFFLLHEVPLPFQIFGSIVVLAGIIIASLSQSTSK